MKRGSDSKNNRARIRSRVLEMGERLNGLVLPLQKAGGRWTPLKLPEAEAQVASIECSPRDGH
jgi:hypothetical protein